MPWDKPRDPKRIDPTLEEIRRYWKRHPDARLGQIVVNAARSEGVDASQIEKERLLQGLRVLDSSLTPAPFCHSAGEEGGERP
jgi:uncharacterized protein YihD (DUF1040 family)